MTINDHHGCQFKKQRKKVEYVCSIGTQITYFLPLFHNSSTKVKLKYYKVFIINVLSITEWKSTIL